MISFVSNGPVAGSRVIVCREAKTSSQAQRRGVCRTSSNIVTKLTFVRGNIVPWRVQCITREVTCTPTMLFGAFLEPAVGSCGVFKYIVARVLSPIFSSIVAAGAKTHPGGVSTSGLSWGLWLFDQEKLYFGKIKNQNWPLNDRKGTTSTMYGSFDQESLFPGKKSSKTIFITYFSYTSQFRGRVPDDIRFPIMCSLSPSLCLASHTRPRAHRGACRAKSSCLFC